jgi:predicted Zn-dependent peptidase
VKTTSTPLVIAALAASLQLAACGSSAPPALAPPAAAKAPAKAAEVPASPLDDKPALATPKTFEPPAPEVWKLPSGLTVWLVERHALPLVAATLVVPAGSSADPPDVPGLAHLTADLLDEGAGTRSAVELSSALQDLGAALSTSNTADGSFVRISVLKKNLAPALALFGDVVARPRFDAKEHKRVASLWANDLTKRADDPMSVTRVVWTAALYGSGSSYGHPADGLTRGVKGATLPAVKRFYGEHYRPDRAVLVVAGDVTRKEVTDLATSSLAGWSAKGSGAAAPPEPGPAPESARPRLVLVDRPDAPQSVIAVVRDGVAARHKDAPPLDLVNTALGGSFTSRLNQNLREDHGWTYGARSGFTEVRGQGAFLAMAAVQTEVTIPALREMLRELELMAAKGMSDDEVAKVRAQDRAALVQTYEAVDDTAERLAKLASLGLSPSFDVEASRARQAATKAQLDALARAHVGPAKATVVVVGPRDKLAELASLGLGEPAIWSAEGEPSAPVSPQRASK